MKVKSKIKNRLMTTSEIKAVIKTFPSKEKVQGQMALLNSTNPSKETNAKT